MDSITTVCAFFIIAIFYSFLIAVSIATIHFSVFFLGDFGMPVGALLTISMWIFVSINIGNITNGKKILHA